MKCKMCFPHSFPSLAPWPSPRCLRRKNIISPYLKSPHISGVSCRLQTILVALQEKLQEEPAEVNKRTHVVRISNDETMKEMPRLIICHSGRKNKRKHTHTQSKATFIISFPRRMVGARQRCATSSDINPSCLARH